MTSPKPKRKNPLLALNQERANPLLSLDQDEEDDDEQRVRRMNEERKSRIDSIFGAISKERFDSINPLEQRMPGGSEYDEMLSPAGAEVIGAIGKSNIKNIASGINAGYDIISNPDLWGYYAKLGIETVKGLGNSVDGIGDVPALAFRLIKGMTYDLAIKPFIESGKAAQYFINTESGQFDEEAFSTHANEIGNVASGFATGLLAAKAIRLASTSKMFRGVTSARSADEAISFMETQNPAALIKGADEVMKNAGYMRKVFKGMAEGSLGGAVGGFFMGDTTEERFQNAMNSAIVGTILGTGIEAGLHAIAGGKKGASATANLMKAKAAEKMVGIIKLNYPLESQAKIALDFARGQNIAHSIIQETPDQVVYLDGFPDAVGLEGTKGIYTYYNPDGTVRILADRINDIDPSRPKSLAEPSITPKAGALFQKYGYAPGQAISYKGSEFIVENISDKYIKLFDPETNKSKTITRKDGIVPLSGPLRTVTRSGESKFISEITSVKANEFNSKKFLETLDADDRIAFEGYNVARSQMLDADQLSLAETLAHRGLYAESHNGKFVVRDAFTSETIGEFASAKALADDIVENGLSALHKATDLIPDLPKGALGVNQSGLYDPADSPALSSKSGMIKKAYTSIVRSTLPLHHRRVGIAAIDNMMRDRGLSSRLLPSFFESQKGVLRATDKIVPAVKRIASVIERNGTFTGDELTHLFNLMGTQSLDDMMTKGIFKGKPINQLTKDLAKTLFEGSNYDQRTAIYKYMSKYDEIIKSAKDKHPDLVSQEIAKLQASESKAVVSLAHSVYETITKLPEKDATILEVFSLADAMESKPPTRAEYIRLNRLDPKKFAGAVDDIDSFFADYAKEFQIPESMLINNYISHIRRYGNEVGKSTFLNRDNAFSRIPQEFFAELSRTGAIKDVVTDPFQIMYKYAYDGYWNMHAKEAVKQLEGNMNKMIAEMQSKGMGKEIKGVQNYVNNYVARLRGNANPYDAIGSTAAVNWLERMGISKYHAHSMTNIWLKISELSAQGFKPMAGIRDMTTNQQLYFMRFGARRAKNFSINLVNSIEAQMKAMKDVPVPEASTLYTMSGLEQLIRESTDITPETKVPGLKGIPGRVIEAALDKVDKFAKPAFSMSGQPLVYRLSWAATYMETYKNTMDAYAKFARKEINQAKFEQLIDLDTYEPSVVEAFTKKLSNNNVETAAKDLAFVTGFEQVGFFGQANHPAFMDSKIGRLAGQFGSWPIWMLDNFGKLASNGRKTNRAKMAARLGIAMGAMYGASKATGYNLESFSLDPRNSIFMGGPLAQVAWFGLNSIGGGPDFAQPMSEWYMKQLMDPTRKNLWNPIPMQLYDVLEGIQRGQQGDPFHIAVGRAIGFPINSEEYPRPE